jgi:hypothetical protein
MQLSCSTVASRPKKKEIGRENLQKRQKTGKKIFHEKHSFLHEILHFMSNCCYKISFKLIVKMFILSFLAVKTNVGKNAEFFRIWPIFFQKFADNSLWDLATVMTPYVRCLQYHCQI